MSTPEKFKKVPKGEEGNCIASPGVSDECLQASAKLQKH